MVICSSKIAFLLSALAFSSITFLSPPSTAALDSSDVEAAAQEVHESIDAMYSILDGLPEQTRRHLNTDIRLLTQSIKRSVDRLESQRPSIIHDAVIHDLHFVADIVHSVSYELRTLEPSAQTEVSEDLSRQLDHLSAAASTRLNHIDIRTDQWIEKKSGFFVQAQNHGGSIVVWYFNRLTLDAIRSIGITLFLIGLLVVAILLRIEKNDRGVYETFIYRSSFWSKSILAVFFSACLVLAMLPTLLAGLSAEFEVHAQEHPCQSLQTQTHQLRLAQRLDSANLIELTKQRMQLTAADCLGVAEAEAIAEIDRLAVNGASTRVARSSLPARERGSVTVRSAQVAAEVKADQAQSAASLPDHSDLSLPEILDPTAAVKAPPKQPSATLGSSLSAMAEKPPVAMRTSLIEAHKEKVREAALAARLSQDEGVLGTSRSPLQSGKQESKTGLVLPAETQKTRSELELYLHFSGPNDRELVIELGNMLKEEGYEVAGIQLVEEAMTAGDIRYRHKDQEEEVENIQIISEEYLNQDLSSEKISLRTVDISERYPNLPRNRIELWLPLLTDSHRRPGQS